MKWLETLRIFLIISLRWIENHECIEVSDGSILTCDLYLCDGLLIEITIFEETVVCPIIIRIHPEDSEGHLTLSNGVCEELCPLHVIRDGFSIQVFTIFVQVNRFFVVVPEPVYLHVFCTLCGDSWQLSSTFPPSGAKIGPSMPFTVNCSGKGDSNQKVTV